MSHFSTSIHPYWYFHSDFQIGTQDDWIHQGLSELQIQSPCGNLFLGTIWFFHIHCAHWCILAHGLIISSCLSMSINMVIVLMCLVGGDNAAAAFVHAAMSNILEGVFLSPLLILGYLSMIGSVNLVGIFSKLAVHVLLPILFGQVLQLSKAVRVAVVKHKKKFKHMSFWVHCSFWDISAW